MIELDKDEAILTLRKNKLDIEHQALLQDREIILIAETGIPLTVANIVVTAQWYAPPNLAGVLVASSIVVGGVEWLRRRKNRQLVEKRTEIDRFISELATAPSSAPPVNDSKLGSTS